jgi:hypothetical protein
MIVSPHFRIRHNTQLVYGGETSTLAASPTSEVTLVGTAPTKDGIDRGGESPSIVCASISGRPSLVLSTQARHDMPARGSFARVTASFYVILLVHLHASFLTWKVLKER